MSSLHHRLRNSSTYSSLTSWLPPLNFITIHYIYFLTTCLITSLIFYGCGSGAEKRGIGYTDCVFLVVSAMTEAGLNTVNLSMMSTGQQFILWFLIGIVSFSLVISFWVFVLDGLRGKTGRGGMEEREKGQKWANFE
jgi:hypothetical protein